MAGIFSNLRGVLANLFQIGGPTGVNLKENSGALEARDSGDAAFVIVRGDDPVGLNDLVTKGYGDTNYTETLQEAYDNGATITTAGATDIEFTLSSGNFEVQGSGLVAFGSTTELSSFSVFSSGTAAIQSRDTTNFNMQASNAAPRSLTVSATNALGDANLVFTQDTRALFTSALGETDGGWRFTQSGTGGDSADLFIGSSDPSGVVSAQAASWFFRDTGSGAEAYQNISTGSGTDWARNVNEVNHKALRDLIHFIDQGPADGFASGSYKETTYTGPLIATETWYEDNTKTQKIVELLVTYTGVFPTSEVWKMYDTDGTTVLVTLTDSIVYSGPFEQTRTRTWA